MTTLDITMTTLDTPHPPPPGGERKVLNRVPSTELDVMCSRSCPGRGGSRPSLSCSMCLTYYHPKCVHLGEESVSPVVGNGW